MSPTCRVIPFHHNLLKTKCFSLGAVSPVTVYTPTTQKRALDCPVNTKFTTTRIQNKGETMKILERVAVLVVFAAVSVAAYAQDEEEGPYVYATYFYCDASTQEDADEIVKKDFAPSYNKAVEDKEILGWGWMAHHTGGKWRRLNYHVASSIDQLLATQESIGDAIDQNNKSASDNFSKICKSHDDYIWQSVTGSDTETRGPVGISVYFYCDIGREDQADEIVKTAFASIYNAHTGTGMLDSWGWSSHIVGGKYRRLATMTAADYKTLMAQRAAVIQELGDNALASTFNEICPSHQDYLWDIQIENP